MKLPESSKNAAPKSSVLDQNMVTPPNFKEVIWFCLLLLIFMYLSVSREGWLFLIIFFIPLVMFGLFFSYRTGLTISKASRKLIAKKKTWVIFLEMLGIQASIVLLCLMIVSLQYGDPTPPQCFDACSPSRNLLEVVQLFLIISTIGSLPAYYAIIRYLKWSNNTSHNIENKIKSTNSN